jgi:peptidoglycan/LPS O-acetylase OafA/YrhL
LIAALDYAAFALDGSIVPDSTTSFFRNLAMLQGYPGELGGATFGTAGQLSSLAAEFHIYYLVGGAFFFCIGRNRIVGLLLAIASAALPLSYFTEASDSARSLFVLWLLGFAGYFIAINMTMDRVAVAICAPLSVFLFWRWRVGHVHGNEYGLISYPLFAAWFVCLAIAAQGFSILSRRRDRVEFFANYSYSLFLIHFTIVKIVVAWSPMPSWATFGAAIVVSNIAAYYFAAMTEARHKKLAGWIMQKLRPGPREDAPVIYERSAE